MDQISAHLDRGWDLVSSGDLPGATVSAQKVLEMNEQSAEAHNLLGYIRAAQGNHEGALEHYRHAIEIDDSFVEAMLNAAEVMIHPLEDYSGALGMVDEALDAAHESDEKVDALLLRVDVLLRQDQKREAARAAAQLPTGPFENPHLEYMVGRAKFEAGDLDGAEPRIRASVKADGGNPEALYYLGLIEEARECTQQSTVAFLRSRDADLRLPPPPWSMSAEYFEQRVHKAIGRLAKETAAALEGTLVIVTDMPGAEIVADGLDPRVGIVLDDGNGNGKQARIGRAFVYQRNIERIARGPLEVEDEIYRRLERELNRALESKQQPETN